MTRWKKSVFVALIPYWIFCFVPALLAGIFQSWHDFNIRMINKLDWEAEEDAETTG